MTIRRTDSDDPDFLRLVSQLNAFLAELNGDRDAFYAALNRTDALPTVVVAYLDGNSVGIGAIRPVDEESIEIKRMFVDPAVRGRGVGAAVLAELERWAVERAILETSPKLESAVRVYRRAGYETIPNYGAYVGNPESLCLGRTL